MTLTRRSLLFATAAGAALALLGLPPAHAQAGAEGFVRRFADQLVAIVNGPQGAGAKRAALTPVIDQNVDVPTVARFCLGRFWTQATPAQQQQYVTLFHQVMLNNISGHLGDYTGVRYQLTGAHAQGADEIVGSTIERPQQPTIDVQWVVSTETGAPKIIDVVAEGSSLRLTNRQDYASFLSRNGGSIDALIAALRRQLAAG